MHIFFYKAYLFVIFAGSFVTTALWIECFLGFISFLHLCHICRMVSYIFYRYFSTISDKTVVYYKSTNKRGIHSKREQTDD